MKIKFFRLKMKLACLLACLSCNESKVEVKERLINMPNEFERFQGAYEAEISPIFSENLRDPDDLLVAIGKKYDPKKNTTNIKYNGLTQTILSYGNFVENLNNPENQNQLDSSTLEFQPKLSVFREENFTYQQVIEGLPALETKFKRILLEDSLEIFNQVDQENLAKLAKESEKISSKIKSLFGGKNSKNLPFTLDSLLSEVNEAKSKFSQKLIESGIILDESLLISNQATFQSNLIKGLNEKDEEKVISALNSSIKEYLNAKVEAEFAKLRDAIDKAKEARKSLKGFLFKEALVGGFDSFLKFIEGGRMREIKENYIKTTTERLLNEILDKVMVNGNNAEGSVGRAKPRNNFEENLRGKGIW